MPVWSLLAFAVAAAASPAAAPAAQAPAPPACGDPEHHRFDFWVGRWDVYDFKDNLVAHSLVEPVYGCGIHENWMPLKRPGGGSLSIYVPAARQWEQFWIDSAGDRVLFKGGWDGKAMVIAGIWPASPDKTDGPMTRMTYTRLADGSVRQLGEQSADGGRTWATAFDFTYRRPPQGEGQGGGAPH